MGQPDTKTVENDSDRKILMDLIGLLGAYAFLPFDDTQALMDRIVEVEKNAG